MVFLFLSLLTPVAEMLTAKRQTVVTTQEHHCRHLQPIASVFDNLLSVSSVRAA